MKKGYSYSFSLSSDVYGYSINTSFFKQTSKGQSNVYITTVYDHDKGYDELHEACANTIEESLVQHTAELQKCFNGEYDNHYIKRCEVCEGNRYTKESLALFEEEMDNPELFEDCPICKGEGYSIEIREVTI